MYYRKNSEGMIETSDSGRAESWAVTYYMPPIVGKCFTTTGCTKLYCSTIVTRPKDVVPLDGSMHLWAREYTRVGDTRLRMAEAAHDEAMEKVVLGGLLAVIFLWVIAVIVAIARGAAAAAQ